MVSDSSISIRDVRAGDAEGIAEIFRTAVRIVARRDYTQAQVDAWAPEMIDGGPGEIRDATKRVFIAEIDGNSAGFADLEPDGHVHMMYVHARYQGVGVASALLSRLESVARGLGIQELHTEASITARPFFERRGFQQIEQQVVHLRGESFINYRMKKPLRA